MDSVKNTVVKLYNQGNGDAIYEMCDSSFHQFISQKKFVQWLSHNRRFTGPYIKTKKTGRVNDFTVYTAYFKGGRQNLLLAINPSGEITGLAIRPSEKTYKVRDDNPLNGFVDSLVEKEIRPYIQQVNTVGISIGVLYDGERYTYNYGETAKENDQLPTNNTLYEIGSITKTFTATLLAEMVLLGKCKLDDPGSKYLPDSIQRLQLNKVPVTLKTLANHTSGLPRLPSDFFSPESHYVPDDPYKNYTDTILFNYLDTVQLRSVPGTKMVYSNLGFGLLGTILERISGKSYEALLQQYICKPLGMKDTHIVLNNVQQKRFAQGYNSTGKAVGHWHFKSMAGGGAIRSSVNDLMKYLRAHLQDNASTTLTGAFRLCERPTFEFSNGKMGLGWRTPDHLPGIFWKNGGTGGFRSYCAYNKKKQIAVVILSNSNVAVDKAGIDLIRKLSKMR